MKDEIQKDSDPVNPGCSESNGQEPQSRGLDRRRFLKGGAAVATPIILTLASRSVLAGHQSGGGWGGECTMSGMLSGNLSAQPDQDVKCGGRSPGYWKKDHFGYCKSNFKSKRFSDVFDGVWHSSTGKLWDNGCTLQDVLDGHTIRNTSYRRRGSNQQEWVANADKYQFGFHAVAAYLNAYHLRPPYQMSPAEVVDIVSQVISTGYYHDSDTGIELDAEEVKVFFEGTFDAD